MVTFTMATLGTGTWHIGIAGARRVSEGGAGDLLVARNGAVRRSGQASRKAAAACCCLDLQSPVQGRRLANSGKARRRRRQEARSPAGPVGFASGYHLGAVGSTFFSELLVRRSSRSRDGLWKANVWLARWRGLLRPVGDAVDAAGTGAGPVRAPVRRAGQRQEWYRR